MCVCECDYSSQAIHDNNKMHTHFSLRSMYCLAIALCRVVRRVFICYNNSTYKVHVQMMAKDKNKENELERMLQRVGGRERQRERVHINSKN